VEDAITDSQTLRRLVGIDLTREAVPDATTLLQFRHLLEEKELTKAVSAAINERLLSKGLMMHDARGNDRRSTILAAPPPVKNEAKAHDPEMHQTKKGNRWCFGMKALISVDAERGLGHTVVGTPASVADIAQTRGEEETVHLDACYRLIYQAAQKANLSRRRSSLSSSTPAGGVTRSPDRRAASASSSGVSSSMQTTV